MDQAAAFNPSPTRGSKQVIAVRALCSVSALVAWAVVMSATILATNFYALLSHSIGDGRAIAADRLHDTPVRGVVRAVRQATLSADHALMALDVPFREGDRFTRGDVLIAFDCRRRIADRGSVVAQLREAELNLASSRFLDRHNAVGKNEVSIAEARVSRMQSEQAALDALIDDCKVLAPFDGRVIELGIRMHERTVPQRPFMSVVDDSALEIETIVPSDMLELLRSGASFSFRVDELGGRAVTAHVSLIAAAVDPVSKTVKVIGTIGQTIPGLLPGMSGTAQFMAGH